MEPISSVIVMANIKHRLELIIENICGIKMILPVKFTEMLKKILSDDISKSDVLLELTSLKFTVLPEWIFENKSSTKYRSVRTINGYPMDVAKSAMQKYARRGIPLGCMYSMAEMFFFRHLEDGKSAFTNFKNRIKVVLLEDVGIASPAAIPLADKLLDSIEVSSDPFPSALVTLCWLISNSLHYRMYSIQRTYYYNNIPKPNTPQQQFPLVDIKYKQIVDSLVYCLENKDCAAYWWMNELAASDDLLTVRYYNCSRVPFLGFAVLEWFFKKQENIHKLIWDNFKVCLKWYKNLKVKENNICMFHPMYLYILGEKFDFDQPVYEKKGNIDYYSPNILNKKYKFIDAVYDMHTLIGKRMGKDSVNFASEGSLVGFEDMCIDIPLSREIYVNSKVSDGIVKTEKSLFTLKSRAQLTCSMSRPDVYFAKTNNRNVVVKGPYSDYNQANKTFQMSMLLTLFENVNTVPTNIIIAVPDMFENVPVGCRKNMPLDEPYYFLVFDDLYDMSDYPVRYKSSKLWNNEKVVDFESLFSDINAGFATPSDMSEKTKISLLYQLAIRYTFELGDFASRNFTWVDDKVWNLDIEGVFVGKSIRWKKTEREILVKTLKKHKDMVINVLKNWLKPVGENVSLYDRWYMVSRVMNISIERAKTNLLFLIENYESWLME